MVGRSSGMEPHAEGPLVTERPLSRRDLIKGGGALGAVIGLGPLLAACGGSGSGAGETAASISTSELFPDLSGQTITMVTYGGETQKALVEAYAEPFSEKTGLKILQDAPVDYAKLKAQVQSGNVTWDIVDGDPLTSEDFCGELIEELRPETLEGTDPQYDSGDCAVPLNVYASMIAYNTDQFGDNAPTGWADFFDTAKFPGKRGMWTAAFVNQYEAALLADGVAPDALYPLDLDRAIRKLDTIKQDCAFFDSLGQGGEQLMSESVAMTCINNNRAFLAAKQGAPYAPVWNQAILAWEAWVIPKGAPNKAAAEAFLRFMRTAEAQDGVASSVAFGSTVPDPKLPKGADELVQTWLPTAPANRKQTVTMDADWWAKNSEEAIERYTEWASS